MLKRLMLIAATVASITVPAASAEAQDYRHRGGDRERGYDRDHRGRGDDRRGQRGRDRWERNNRDWWRGRNEFRGYSGRRNGYYFAPGYGYYRSDPRYSNHRWNRGSYLPRSYRNYYVQDTYFYGVRDAPYGYRWVYVDNDLVLVSIATGLILDVLLDVY